MATRLLDARRHRSTDVCVRKRIRKARHDIEELIRFLERRVGVNDTNAIRLLAVRTALHETAAKLAFAEEIATILEGKNYDMPCILKENRGRAA